MSSRYSLTCPDCQHSNEILTTQAGQDLACANCQKTIQAPRLGELKQLPVVSAAESTNSPQSKKGGGLFVAGLLLLILGGGGGAGLYYYASQKLFDYEKEVEGVLANANVEIQAASTKDLLQTYDMLPIENGLGAWQERPYVGNHKQGVILTNIAYGLFAIGGLGFLMTLAGLLRK